MLQLITLNQRLLPYLSQLSTRMGNEFVDIFEKWWFISNIFISVPQIRNN